MMNQCALTRRSADSSCLADYDVLFSALNVQSGIPDIRIVPKGTSKNLIEVAE